MHLADHECIATDSIVLSATRTPFYYKTIYSGLYRSLYLGRMIVYSRPMPSEDIDLSDVEFPILKLMIDIR